MAGLPLKQNKLVLPIGNRRAVTDFYDLETSYLKSNGPFIIVCNRFNRKYEDVILYDFIKRWNPHCTLITTNPNSEGELKSEKIINAKHSPMENWTAQRKNIIKAITACIKNNESVVIFPSRRLRNYSLDRILWDKAILKCIYELGVPVITVCVRSVTSGDNGWTSVLRNLKYIFSSKQEFHLQIRVGKPLFVPELKSFKKPKAFRRYLFTKTHALGTSTDLEKFYNHDHETRRMSVAAQINPEILKREIAAIEKYRVAQKGHLEVYICSALNIPAIMKQLGVLREITYREAGEGTGKALDIDEFDLYYRQIFIWDSKAAKIVGGYRMGCGDEIMNAYGRSGFYLNTLFKLKKGLEPVLLQSLEMGRSFIVKEYQKEAFPLFLLWKAIFFYVNKGKTYRYLLGPVSISAEYSRFSRQLIVAFLNKHFYDEKMAKLAVPRNPFKKQMDLRSKRSLLLQFDGALGQLDKFIEEIEPRHFRLPVLIKQYIKQNSKFIGFNVDPEFSNAVDCLIVLDLQKLPDSTIDNLK